MVVLRRKIGCYAFVWLFYRNWVSEFIFIVCLFYLFFFVCVCDLGTLNPDLFMASGGVAALTRNLMECQTPKIAEALCGVLLLLLDRPCTRNQASVDLHCVAAPYCDFHYRHGWMDKNR